MGDVEKSKEKEEESEEKSVEDDIVDEKNKEKEDDELVIEVGVGGVSTRGEEIAAPLVEVDDVGSATAEPAAAESTTAEPATTETNTSETTTSETTPSESTISEATTSEATTSESVPEPATNSESWDEDLERETTLSELAALREIEEDKELLESDYILSPVGIRKFAQELTERQKNNEDSKDDMTLFDLLDFNSELNASDEIEAEELTTACKVNCEQDVKSSQATSSDEYLKPLLKLLEELEAIAHELL